MAAAWRINSKYVASGSGEKICCDNDISVAIIISKKAKKSERHEKKAMAEDVEAKKHQAKSEKAYQQRGEIINGINNGSSEKHQWRGSENISSNQRGSSISAANNGIGQRNNQKGALRGMYSHQQASA